MSGACSTCPFKGSDEVEQAINLGCVPSVFEIMQMKRDANLNWGCHSDGDVMCAGFRAACKATGLDAKSGDLLTYERFYHEGVPT